ncbi:MAG: PAS domain-containing protein [Bacteroidia bacterium]|nr:PAS domain-containing protein [Bacteroidia bacterium]MBP9923885.1 PAS domain-containing protein [Bacteroidia bacterium]
MYSLKDYILRTKDFLAQSQEKILIVNPEGKVVYINDVFLALTGYDRKEVSKLHLNKLIGPTANKLIENEIKKSNVCISKQEFHFLNSKKKLSFFAFNTWNGNLVTGRVILISEDTKVKTELKDNLFQNSILRAMDQRRDAVWFVSDIITLKNLFMSSSVKTIFGWEPKHLILGGWVFFLSIIHPDDISSWLSSFNEWLIMKGKLGLLYDHVEFSGSFRMKNAKGEYLPVECFSNILERDENGKIKLLLGSYRAIDQNAMKSKMAEQKTSVIKIIDGKTYVELDYLKKLREQRSENTNKQPFKNLSQRELEILELIVDEYSSEEISKKINISIHTVNLHRKQIMKKMEAKNLAGLIRIYYTSK